jgi:hypothetical protein
LIKSSYNSTGTVSGILFWQSWQLQIFNIHADLISDNLHQGYYQFCIKVVSLLELQQNTSRAAHHDALQEDFVTPSLADTQELLASTMTCFMQMDLQLVTQYQIFMVLIIPIFGNNHLGFLVLKFFRLQLVSHLNVLVLYKLCKIHAGQKNLWLAMVMRYWQLYCSNWGEQQINSIAPPSPHPISCPPSKFMDVFLQMQLGADWEPSTPLQYLCKITYITAPQ